MVSKAVNYNKLLSHIVSSLSVPLCVTQRPFPFTFFSPNTMFYIPNQRKFSIDFENKLNNNIWSQLPLPKHKGLRGVANSTKRRHHFEIMITPMWSGFREGHENNINFIKDKEKIWGIVLHWILEVDSEVPLWLKRSSRCGGSVTRNNSSWWPPMVVGDGGGGVRTLVGVWREKEWKIMFSH